jgi:uncharacterized membrane protein
MNKLSSREIQVFVAGALALMGLHSLVVTPYYIFVSKSLSLSAVALLSALPLLIGIAMLKGNERALKWAQIYLWLCFIGAVMRIGFAVSSNKPEHSDWWQYLSDFLTLVVLIWLLKRSNPDRFDQTPNKLSEPTADDASSSATRTTP